jgi:DUF1680 family protein
MTSRQVSGAVVGGIAGVLLVLAGAIRARGQELIAGAREELLPLEAVRLLDGPVGRQQEVNRRYLLSLEPDRLLSLFRVEAGLEPKAPPYRGWESEPPKLYGHILGFYLSGASLMVEATGDPVLKERIETIVRELDEVQNATGSGYLLPVPGGKRLFEEVAAGRFEITHAGPNYGAEINGVFEPTYTWNKITLGLYEAARATGSETARKVLIRTADWFGHDVLDHLDDAQVQKLLFCEHGSIHESMVRVYELTRDPKYLRWARRLCFERVLAPLAENHGDFLNGYHANCTIPVFTGLEAVARHTGEARLHTAATNFLDEMISRRSWVIGGNSAAEHFFPVDQWEQALQVPAGPETCNSVNMLRLIEALHVSRPDHQALDLYERILWNHLLAVHDPERGMFTYYTPLRPGAYRVYSDPYDSMWCCVGTGLEVPGKYGQMIYGQSAGGTSLDVNLFIASELRSLKDGKPLLRQETAFPDEPRTSLVVLSDDLGGLPIRVRHPGWVPAGQMRLAVNGEAIANDSKPGTYVELRRIWKAGDRLTVELPMHLSAEPLPGSTRYAAFVYGPIVLSGHFGREGLSKLDFWSLGDTLGRRQRPESEFPVLVADSIDSLAEGLEAVPGRSLTFRTRSGLARPSDAELIPFFRNHFERTTVYWKVLTPAAYETEQAARAEAKRVEAELEARTIDRVEIGDAGSESDHAFRGEQTDTGMGAYGERPDMAWRHARSGGWFEYRVKVSPDRPVLLSCTYWGQERGARTFDIVVDGQRVATTSLGDRGVADFVRVEERLPEELTRGKDGVTVRFVPHAENTAGGLFGLRVLSVED